VYDKVELTWRSRPLVGEEKYQVKLVRRRDGQEWRLEPTTTSLIFTFDAATAIFDQPGDFEWSVQIVNPATNQGFGFSPVRWFKFERRNDQGADDGSGQPPLPVEPTTAPVEPTPGPRMRPTDTAVPREG
jgi:hypothetical protein